MTDLSTVTTEELFDELRTRCDAFACAFIAKVRDEGASYRYHGHSATLTGLTRIMAADTLKQSMSSLTLHDDGDTAGD